MRENIMDRIKCVQGKQMWREQKKRYCIMRHIAGLIYFVNLLSHHQSQGSLGPCSAVDTFFHIQASLSVQIFLTSFSQMSFTSAQILSPQRMSSCLVSPTRVIMHFFVRPFMRTMSSG